MAYANAAASVIFVGVVVWILAALTHAQPNIVLGCSASAVNRESLFGQHTMEASTAACSAIKNVVDPHGEFSPAAATRPPIATGYMTQDCNPAKDAAREINWSIATPAAASVAAPQIHTAHHDDIAAVAFASPHRLVVAIVWGAINDRELVKRSPSHVGYWHTQLYHKWKVQVGPERSGRIARYLRDGD